MNTENNLFDEIYSAIYELSKMGTPRDRIKITTSFITKRLLEENIQESILWHIRTRVEKDYSNIFGIDISFDHFKNDIVIYDTGRACFDNKFRIVIPIKVKL
jgi:hypothetical protein